MMFRTRSHIAAVFCAVLLPAAAFSGGGEKMLQDYLTGLPFEMPPLAEPVFPPHRVSIVDFGAKGDGSVLNTDAFAGAIGACAAAGGGTVVVPPGTWLTGPIRLESNINLFLERGALIQFSSRFGEFPLIAGLDGKSKRFMVTPPIHAYRASNIAITGHGVIDGAGEAWRYVKKEKLTESQWKELTGSGGVVTADGRQWWPSREAMEGGEYLAQLEKSEKGTTAAEFARAHEFLRPDLVRLVQCEGILLDGPTFRNSPKFHLHLVQSENIIVRNVSVMTPWWAQNGDGLDLAACRNVLVYNTTVDVGDDAICLKPSRIAERQKPGPACENIVIADCIVYHGHGGFVVGSESFGGARNIAVRNCTFIGTDVGLRFKSLRGKGGLVERIFIEGIRMRGIRDEAILFDMFYGGEGSVASAEPVNDLTPRFRDIAISDLVCLGARRAVLVKGLPEMPVSGVRIDNARITADEGVLCINTEGLTIARSTIAPLAGPVVTLRDSRNITIERTEVPERTDLFLRVEGERSGGIRLRNMDFAPAKKSVESGPEVPPGAVIQEARGK